MNKGLSEKLKLAFPSVVPVLRPLVENSKTIDPHWLAGFVAGEGSFIINIQKSSTYSLGQGVILFFVITQHLRDQQLLFSVMECLACGNVYQKGEVFDFRVSKFADITEKIIPFFKKYQIHGVKAKDFNDWCQVAKLMKEKKHLTIEGLEQIKKNQSWYE